MVALQSNYYMESSQLATIFGIVCCVTDCYANSERLFDLFELLAIIRCDYLG